MTISKIPGNGAIFISDIVDGYLCRRTYYGYTKTEALASFCQEFGLDPDELESED